MRGSKAKQDLKALFTTYPFLSLVRAWVKGDKFVFTETTKTQYAILISNLEKRIENPPKVEQKLKHWISRRM